MNLEQEIRDKLPALIAECRARMEVATREATAAAYKAQADCWERIHRHERRTQILARTAGILTIVCVILSAVL